MKIEEIKNIDSKTNDINLNVIKPKKSEITRIKQDIQKWRKAIASVEKSENASYFPYIKICKEIELDSVVTSSRAIRDNIIINQDFIFKKNGEITEDVEIYFKDEWFSDFITYCLEAIYYGWAGIKIGDIIEDMVQNVELLPFQNVNPKLNAIMETADSTKLTSESVLFDDKKIENYYILLKPCQNSDHLGLYNKIAPYFIQLKEAQIAFTDFVDMFGTPSLIAKTNMSDIDYVSAMESFLKNFKNANYAILGDRDEINLLESTNSNGELFIKLIEEHKTNIKSLILGSDTLGDEKSFVGSAEISMSIANTFSKKDMFYIENVVNKELIPRLIARGMSMLDGVTFEFDKSEKTDTNKLFEMVVKLLQVGKDVPSDFILEKFGIPTIDLKTPDTTNNNK